GLSAWLRPLAKTVSYLYTVRWALFYGLWISSALRAFISPRWVAKFIGNQPVRGQLACGVAGAPLMLCSCCVAPVAMTVYQRSGKLGPSIGLLLASPSLNPAALLLTFALFGPTLGWARLAMALAMVLVGSALVGLAGGKVD